MKTTLRFISLILAVVMIAASFASCGSKKKLDASDYLEKMLENSAGGAESYNTCLEEIVIDPSVFLGEGSGIDDVVISILSKNSGEAVFSVSGGIEGEKADVKLFYSGSSIVASSSILADSYGFTVDDIMSLGSMVGSMESDDDTVAEVGAIGDLIISVMESNPEDISNTIVKYIEVVADSIDNAADQKVTFGADTITVQIKFNSDSAKKVIKDVFNTLKKDKDLRKLVKEIAAVYIPEGSDELVDEYYDQIFGTDDILDMIFETINEHDFEIGFSVTSDKDYQIKAFNVFGEYNGSGISFGIDATNENDIVVKVGADIEDTKVDAKVNVKTTENGGDKNVNAVLTLEIEGEEMSVEIFNIDLKANGEFSVTVSSDVAGFFGGEALDEGAVGENLVEIKGTFVEEGKSSELTIASITNVVGETINIGVTVKTTYDVEFPAFPADYKLVTELGEEDIAEIMNSVMSDPVVSVLIEMIGGMGGEGYDEY